MPPMVSVRSLNLVEDIRVRQDAVSGAEYPVYVDTRQVRGYFPALKLKELIGQREDLSYVSKTIRNADRDGIPGFTFVREGESTLNDYFKQIETERAAAAKPAEPAAEAPAPAPAPTTAG